jgi:class 3 adenylate cyclase
VRRGRGAVLDHASRPVDHSAIATRPEEISTAGGEASETGRGLVAWAALLLLPLVGFWVLIAAPELDVQWEHHPAHFWLVLGAGVLSAALAYATGDAARRRSDARLFLVSLALLASAGFLALHALATPGVLLAQPNAGFVVAVPVGLLIAGALAAWSALELSRERATAVMRRASQLRLALIAALAAWAAASLADVPPLDDPTPAESGSGLLVGVAAVGLALFAFAAIRYAALYRRRPSPLLIGVLAALALLAEAMIAVAFARNWHATWWEWHLLMLVAFAIVAYGAERAGHEERFSALYLDETAAGKREVSVVFADLAGFTSFSERRDPREVSAMLNAYFDAAIPPVVSEHGGEIDRLVGDQIMATFNTRGDQPDHALRAARAALAIREATDEVARGREDWPRFRIGVNSGDAMVGVVGAPGGRSYTVIGDTVNVAARLESTAPVGGVAIGAATLRGLPGARVESLGAVSVKGKSDPVDAYLLTALDTASGTG